MELIEMLNSATKDKPITRYDIITAFGVSDRAARRMVEELRDKEDKKLWEYH